MSIKYYDYSSGDDVEIVSTANERRWSVKEASIAIGVSYDALCNYVNDNGHSAKDGVTIGMVKSYLQSIKRASKQRRITDEEQNNIDDLRSILAKLGFLKIIKNGDEDDEK